MKNRPIISVHTPKAAGSSFLQQLQRVFGGENLLLDYDDDPADVRSRRNIDPDSYGLKPITSLRPYRAVHGHFHPAKYDFVGNAFRLTFLRHPVDNVVSIYRFWALHSESQLDTPAFRYFKQQQLSLQELASLPIIRHLYTRTYFENYDMGRFDFIGSYSNYHRELQRLSELLDVEFDSTLRVNVTDEITSQFRLPDTLDTASLSEILSDDISFFERYAGR